MVQKRILIVDDDSDYLFLLNHALTEQGYEVVSCRNGAQALRRAKETKPDLIILDLFMPEEDGAEIKLKLDNDAETVRIPVIFLTNLALPGESGNSASQKKSKNIIIGKSHDRTELFRAIQGVLG